MTEENSEERITKDHPGVEQLSGVRLWAEAIKRKMTRTYTYDMNSI